ncbi:MAG: prepilin peptidase [Burkholderiaceae bacterium]
MDAHFMLIRSIVIFTLIVIIAAICVSDFRSRRIPNVLVLTGLAIAFSFHLFAPAGYGIFDRFAPGGIGFTQAAIGALIAFSVFLVLYMIRAMGAGDVKLMAMFGALFGSEHVIGLIVLVFLCGGVLSVVRLFNAERRAKLATNMRLLLMHKLAGEGGDTNTSFDPQHDTADRLPFAVAISSAAVLLAALLDQGYRLPWSIAI